MQAFVAARRYSWGLVAGQRVHPGFAGRVGARGRRANGNQGPYRTYVDDAAAATLEHFGDGRLGCKEGPLNRDTQIGIDVGLTMLEKWRRPEDAGVVNQDVDSAEALDSDCGESFRDRLLTGVAGDPSNSLAAGVEFVRRIPEYLFSAAVDDHFRAAREQLPGCFFSDTGSSPRDNCDLVFEILFDLHEPFDIGVPGAPAFCSTCRIRSWKLAVCDRIPG